MRESIIVRTVKLIGLLAASMPVSAHHNPNVHFDRNQEVEIFGVVTDVKWRSPHVQLKVVVTDDDGREVEWTLDEDAHIALIRRGVSRDQYRVGEPIRVAGFRGRRNPNAMFVTNTLLADGRELVAGQSNGPRWNTDLVMSEESYQANLLDAASARPSGLYRVWSHDLTGDLPDGVVRGLWNDDYPLTDYARTVRENWDEIADNPFMFCRNAMPGRISSIAPLSGTTTGVCRKRLNWMATTAVVRPAANRMTRNSFRKRDIRQVYGSDPKSVECPENEAGVGAAKTE